MCKPCSSLCFPTSFRRAGPAAAELAGAGCNFSSEPGFLAGSNFLIRTPGLPACPLVLSPHSPPVKPHPTGLPTDHSHAQGTARVRAGGATVGSLKWGWVQQRCWGVPKPAAGKLGARSGLLAAHLRFLHPPCLSRGERIPDPRTHKGARGNPEPRGARHPQEKAPRAPPAPALPLLAPRGRGEQMGSREAGPLPQPRLLGVEGGLQRGREHRGPARGGSALRRHMWLDLKSY